MFSAAGRYIRCALSSTRSIPRISAREPKAGAQAVDVDLRQGRPLKAGKKVSGTAVILPPSMRRRYGMAMGFADPCDALFRYQRALDQHLFGLNRRPPE